MVVHLLLSGGFLKSWSEVVAIIQHLVGNTFCVFNVFIRVVNYDKPGLIQIVVVFFLFYIYILDWLSFYIP